jgi:hypothetical protein
MADGQEIFHCRLFYNLREAISLRPGRVEAEPPKKVGKAVPVSRRLTAMCCGRAAGAIRKKALRGTGRPLPHYLKFQFEISEQLFVPSHASPAKSKYSAKDCTEH